MPERRGIIICGEEFDIGYDKIINYTMPGSYSFERARKEYSLAERNGSNLYSPRRAKGGGTVETLEQLREACSMVVVHCDVCWTGEMCFRVLVRRGFSTHFIIDYDGTLYQCADPKDVCWHAGDTNTVSIGIDLNNCMIGIPASAAGFAVNHHLQQMDQLMLEDTHQGM